MALLGSLCDERREKTPGRNSRDEDEVAGLHCSLELSHVDGGTGDEHGAAVTVQGRCQGDDEPRDTGVHVVAVLHAVQHFRHGHSPAQTGSARIQSV